MITITLDTRRGKDQLNLLALPPKQRKRLVWRAANEMKKLAARHVRQQQASSKPPTAMPGPLASGANARCCAACPSCW